MVSFHWTDRSGLKNLPELLAKRQAFGGMLVEYDIVYSIIFVSFKIPRIVWIRNSLGRISMGILYSIPTFLLGWWSITGFFMTIGALVKNMMGGIDVTLVFTNPPPAPGQEWDPSVIAAIEKQRKIQSIVFGVILFSILAVLVKYLVLPHI